MINRMAKKVFILLFFSQNSVLFAGAVLRIDRIDLKNGKKIILFGEKHRGPINPELQNNEVCNRQFTPFLQLFHSFIRQKQNYALLIEYNDWSRSRDTVSGQTFGMPGCAAAWFDRFYEGLRTGKQDWPFVDTVVNFDKRTKFDALTLEMFGALVRFQKGYQESGYALFNERKNHMTVSGPVAPYYKEWKELFSSTPIREFEKRLEQQMIQLNRLLSPADYQILFNLINARTLLLAQYMYFESKVRFLNTTTVDYTIDLIGSAKNNFYKELAEFIRSDVPLNTPYLLVSFINVITDLSLLEMILTDTHPVILVSLGANHAHNVIENFLKQSEMTRSVKSLDMLDPQILNNPEYAVKAVMEFVHGN